MIFDDINDFGRYMGGKLVSGGLYFEIILVISKIEEIQRMNHKRRNRLILYI
jgi:hypothetical protein